MDAYRESCNPRKRTLRPISDEAAFLRQVKTNVNRPGIDPVFTDRSRRKLMTTERGPQRIPPYEIGDGQEESDVALTGISTMFGGYVPNIHKVMANSPAMIEAFEAMRRALQKTKISAPEREIISIEVSRRSQCDYCMTAHTHFARRMRVSDDDIAAAMAGHQIIDDPRLALVQSATQRLLDRRARLSDEELESFREQGLSDTELLEIVAVIGWYVMSTYTNNLAVTAIDDIFKG
jgi:uncharacterized peroxidase-related enzyme